MSTLLTAAPPRTLERLLTEAGAGQLALWCFDDRAARQAAEAALAARGISARIRSAYKPLLHAFLEEILLEGLTEAAITYPVHPDADPKRFRLETYPLAALLPDVRITLIPGGPALHYDLDLTYGAITEKRRVFAPNRHHVAISGLPGLSPTGWIVSPTRDERLETDLEALFDAAMTALAGRNWSGADGTPGPYFDQLVFDVTLPARDEPLAHGDEVLALAEALHEDLYFSSLEYFQHISGRPAGDRGLQPGQIVPRVRRGPEPRLEVRLQPFPKSLPAAHTEPPELDKADAPLSPGQIAASLDLLGGETFTATTRTGRTLEARQFRGDGAPVMISAGQHANETTGIVGALRAGRRLAAEGAAFTLSPLENPDGYALHQALIAENPRHMHHAARYTALGDDLEYREEPGILYEKAIRHEAERRSGAQLHINLHGYPSHEWTRPLSGYVPRHFAMWTLPKGFFLILRHHPDWVTEAEALVDAVTAHLAAVPGVLEENARQIALYEAHAGETGFQMINGFPCLIGADARHRVPVTLITEYPDETIYGPAFVQGQTVQMETVLAARAAWQRLHRPAAIA